MISYAYFARDASGLIKIGASIHPLKRVLARDLCGARMLFMISPAVATTAGYDVESALHRHFKDQRVLRRVGKKMAKEWYELSDGKIVLPALFQPRWKGREGVSSMLTCKCHPRFRYEHTLVYVPVLRFILKGNRLA